MCSDLGQGSRCCAFYSATGFIFTLYVGILLTTQPFLIAGIEDEARAQSSAYGATGMFAFTFLASLGGIWYDSQNQAEPISNSEEPESAYHLSQDTPTSYGTSA